MVTISQLIDQCQRTYEKSALEAGIDGRDGANVFPMPSGEIILCFRGTLANHDLQSALDWVQDFHAKFVSADGFPGRVHAGFLNSLNALWDGIMASLEGHQPQPPESTPEPWWRRLLNHIAAPQSLVEENVPPLPWDKQLVITGHSKGGALAQLAAVRLAALKPRVVTFGAPMTGDLAFASNYPDLDLTRYEGNYDLVPFLPGRFMGYREVPGECKTQFPMGLSVSGRHLRETAIGRLIAEQKWDQIRANHALETGYLPWCVDKETAPNMPTGDLRHEGYAAN